MAGRQPYPLIFTTLSGAHHYGFPSPDSDFDLRGAHVLPAADVLGLFPPRETIEQSVHEGGRDLDIVTHDARKFFTLLLKRNGYVLEQVYSPLIVHTTPEHQELRTIAQACITRFHAQHYLGFVQTQWKLFEKQLGVKPLLYVYRVLFTGIHLMRTGEVQANLVTLNETFRLSHVGDLLAYKAAHAEKADMPNVDVEFHRGECARLTALLEQAQAESRLPEVATARPALSDLLIRLRQRSS
jgi:predicted nucleotidyltransferase